MKLITKIKSWEVSKFGRNLSLALVLIALAMLFTACGSDSSTTSSQTWQVPGSNSSGSSTASSTSLLKKLLGKWEASSRVPFSVVVVPGEEVEFRTDNYFVFDPDNIENSPRYQVTGSEQAGKLLLEYSYQRVLYNFQLSEDSNTLRMAKADVALPAGVTFPYTLRRVQEVAPSLSALTRADGVWEKITVDKAGSCLEPLRSFRLSKLVFSTENTFQFGALPASATSPVQPLRTGKYSLSGNILSLTYTGKLDPMEKADRVFSAKCQVKLTQTKLSLATLPDSATTSSPPVEIYYVQSADNKF